MTAGTESHPAWTALLKRRGGLRPDSLRPDCARLVLKRVVEERRKERSRIGKIGLQRDDHGAIGRPPDFRFQFHTLWFPPAASLRLNFVRGVCDRKVLDFDSVLFHRPRHSVDDSFFIRPRNMSNHPRWSRRIDVSPFRKSVRERSVGGLGVYALQNFFQIHVARGAKQGIWREQDEVRFPHPDTAIRKQLEPLRDELARLTVDSPPDRTPSRHLALKPRHREPQLALSGSPHPFPDSQDA